MKRIVLLATCFAALMTLVACGGAKPREEEFKPTPLSTPLAGAKIKVGDVSNNTGQLFDVDVIGMLWNSLDLSLKKRGLLYEPGSPDSQETPLTIEAHITNYEKGNVLLRPCLPLWGRSVLKVRAELKDNGRVIASTEAQEKITLGSGTFTMEGYKKVFATVGEELVSQMLSKR